MKNWSENYTYRATRVHYPRDSAETAALVGSSERIRPLGTRHTFHNLADSEEGELISLANLNRVVRVDASGKPTVTVEGGVNYASLCRFLDGIGYALPNMASLPHISVAGA